MPSITVAPQSFAMVLFDSARIAALVDEVALLVGVPDDVELHLRVDETSPFGQTWTVITGRRVEITAEGGAFEDPKRVRQLSEGGTRLVLGRILLRALDRLDPGFGSPPPDPELSFAQHAAWDAYALGRYARRADVDGRRDRRRYAFRLRHGFTDLADRAFDRLWDGANLTWVDIETIAAEAGRTSRR